MASVELSGAQSWLRVTVLHEVADTARGVVYYVLESTVEGSFCVRCCRRYREFRRLHESLCTLLPSLARQFPVRKHLFPSARTRRVELSGYLDELISYMPPREHGTCRELQMLCCFLGLDVARVTRSDTESAWSCSITPTSKPVRMPSRVSFTLLDTLCCEDDNVDSPRSIAQAC